MTFSKIRSIWQISLQNMVMVTSYFIKQSVPVSSAIADMHGVLLLEDQKPSLKMICNDFFVVKVNCLSSVFNIMKSILLLRNGKNTTILEKKAS